MNLDRTSLLKYIASQSSSARALLDELHLDYFSRGDASLERACREAGLDCAAVLAALERREPLEPTAASHEARPETASSLVDALINERYPILMAELRRLQTALVGTALGGDVREPLSTLVRLVDSHVAAARELAPAIRQMQRAREGLAPWPRACPGLLGNEITSLEAGGRRIVAHLREMTRAHPSSSPGWPPAIDEAVRKLEAALHETLHFENNVLWPRAAMLDASPSDVS